MPRTISPAGEESPAPRPRPRTRRRRIVDVWLATAFKEGWAPAIQDFLAQSKPEIAALRFAGAAGEDGKANVPSVPFPSAPIFVDSSEAGGGFEPTPGLGCDRCMWCRLREDGAAAGQHGTRLRALVRFPKASFRLPCPALPCPALP